jgi:hypothetical protein
MNALLSVLDGSMRCQQEVVTMRLFSEQLHHIIENDLKLIVESNRQKFTI